MNPNNRQVQDVALGRPSASPARPNASWQPGRTFAVLCTALALAPALAAPCDGPAHRAFDFWLGTWNVHTPDGKLAGVNRVERGYGGCVLHERYASERGYAGESLNVYDAARKVWHQTWVDNQGTLLVLEGGLQDASMVLQGQVAAADGKLAKHRITWTPHADGSVRQHWESSDAQGAWRTVFDGRYTRK